MLSSQSEYLINFSSLTLCFFKSSEQLLLLHCIKSHFYKWPSYAVTVSYFSNVCLLVCNLFSFCSYRVVWWVLSGCQAAIIPALHASMQSHIIIIGQHTFTHTHMAATIQSISHGRYGTALGSNQTAVQCLSVGIRREGLIANAILIDREQYCEDLQKLFNNFTNIDKTWTFVIEVPTNNNYDAMMFLFRLLWSMMRSV